MGPVPFDQQSRVYASSLLSVGMDNLLDRWFFSNRLPVALASGIPLLYQRNPGFSEVFPADLNDLFFDEPRSVFGAIDELVSSDRRRLDESSWKNRGFFEANLTKVSVARFIVRNTAEVPELMHCEVAVAWQRIPPLVEVS